MRLAYVLLWLISGSVFAYYYITTQTDIDNFTLATRRLETRNSLPSGLKREDVSSLGKQLKASRTVLSTLQIQSLLWAPKLNLIRSYLPEDAWLNRLSCRKSTTAFAKPQSSGGRRQPPKPLGEFVIEGMVLIPEGKAGAESLDQFVIRLRGDKMFMEKISTLNHLVVGRERYGNREVATFVIVCVIEEGVRFDA